MGQYSEGVQAGAILGGGLNRAVASPSPAAIQFAVRRLDDLVRRARVVAERFDDSLTQFGGSAPTVPQGPTTEPMATSTLAELNNLLDDGFRVIDTLESLSVRAKDLLG